jgi:hypothetical protein
MQSGAEKQPWLTVPLAQAVDRALTQQGPMHENDTRKR